MVKREARLIKEGMLFPAEAGKVALPFVVWQGAKDTLVGPSGARMLYDKASSADKTLKIYDELHHKVFNEPERVRVLKEVETWLAAHVSLVVQGANWSSMIVFSPARVATWRAPNQTRITRSQLQPQYQARAEWAGMLMDEHSRSGQVKRSG